MLFIFSTHMASKYFMRIEREPQLKISILDMTAVKEALSDLIIDLPDGKLDEICRIGNLLVLMWNFDDYTRCSDATKEDFVNIDISTSIFDIPKPIPKGTVSLPFFILEEKESIVFENVDCQILSLRYGFPEVSENIRLESLKTSLVAHSYRVHRVDPTKTTEHYCQFSGGGDLCVTKNVAPPLVIVSPTDEVDTTTALDQGTSGGDMPSSGTSGGGIDNLDKLKFQLWANMILIAVKKFKDSLPLCTKKDILELKQLVGYGMACGGDGTIGVYKLQMRFGQSTVIETKIELGARERLTAAALMDFTLQYYNMYPM